MPAKVAVRTPTSLALTTEERAEVEELADLKYDGLVGFTTVLREEGMKAVRAELARLKEAQTTTPNQQAD